ncbi:MAG TPA: M23 family metallopeptidase [Pseudogracilibacillus sp.]|nr:M23 family metallopeptidase [Pseudogracilibacillus sp.]
MTILFSLIMLIILPAIFIILLWRATFTSRLEWLLDAIVTMLLISWLTLSGNWSWVGYYIRFLWPLIFLFALYFSWKKTKELPFVTTYTGGQKFTIAIYIVLIFVFGSYNIGPIKSYTVHEEAIDLKFPMKDGTYYVGQGGNHVSMNYHQIAPSQKYALDVLKINTFGIRAKGLYPNNLEKYYIFEDDLISPCTGEILDVQNDLNDLTPPDMDPDNPEGNHIKLLCDHHNAHIYLAHMQKGSVAVSPGDQVDEGDFIGRIGNSGNTTEPHLHIHAELNGKGVPITFDGRFLVRNSLVK